MARSRAKEAGRKRLVREKADTLKERRLLKAPSKEIIKQAGRYRTIETARKQLNEAKQSIAPDQEQQPYTAVDKVERYSVNAAHNALRALPVGARKTHSSVVDNSFHGETDYEAASPQPKEQMRRAFVRQVREQKQQSVRRNPIPVPQEKSSKMETYRGIEAPAQIRKHKTAGQRQNALSRDKYSAAISKAQIVKEQGRRLARDKAMQEIKTDTAKTAAKASENFFKKLGTAVTRTVTPSKETLLYAAGALALIIIPLVVIMGVASMLTGSGDGRNAYIPVSTEVEAYRPLIRLYAAQHGIPEYEDLIAAVMMQESGGQGSDPMQCSESGYNTRYPHSPNSITDPEYSIDVGIQALANALQMASVESPIDLANISLALQGYNFGNGYISWALANYGGYSELNAIEFSDMMAARLSWSGYGDKAYVSHVLRYYPIGRSFMSEGNVAMVAVAQSQLGIDGGLKFCEWYGYPYRVEWCAIFVSWVADQCGYIDAGVIPKFAYCPEGANWFMANGQWQGRDYIPAPGDIIFFDWENDGIADHVGIVEFVENDMIYTIEGNVGESCVENRYYLYSSPVYGFGLPLY